ncbi:MAG: hypothetical protein A2Y56_04650 [Candidatus Aminicenantes bacterium RBG_13_63_10]|nr:MAG: hypothetical protein A2Y56_04650 [Candidatus Aminicenantes bacterium RBG_13_63_10]
MTKKLTADEFVKLAIQKLRAGSYKGVHSVYSGFNEAFKLYFSGENPIPVTNKMAEDGAIVVRPTKGGMVLYLPEDAPKTTRGEEALKKMGLL